MADKKGKTLPGKPPTGTAAASLTEDILLSLEEPNVKKTSLAQAPAENEEADLGFSLIDEMEEADKTFSDDISKSGSGQPEAQKNFAGPEDLSEVSVATVVGQLSDFVAKVLPAKAPVKTQISPPKPPSTFGADDEATRFGVVDQNVEDLLAEGLAQSQLEEPLVADPLKVDAELAALGPIDVSRLKGSGQDFETLKRYAALKERESRERETISEVLRQQIAALKAKLTVSEKERRKLSTEFEEIRSTLKGLEDTRDQHQHSLRKAEQSHSDNQRAIQARLDSAQFQATRAERKLSEFKERVKNDLLKIRSRERELANKLEIQKRDAESLLQAKDERLLSLKREIDRLEFEITNLKERRIEETEKAEERAGKLIRALQSLKMAQGVLTGIEEEVLPSASVGVRKKAGGDAA